MTRSRVLGSLNRHLAPAAAAEPPPVVAIDGLLSAEKVATLRAAAAELLAAEGGRAGWEATATTALRPDCGSQKLCNLFGKGAPWRELASDERLLAAARAQIGTDLRWVGMDFAEVLADGVEHGEDMARPPRRSANPNCTGYCYVVIALDDSDADTGGVDVAGTPCVGLAGGAVCISGDAWFTFRPNSSPDRRSRAVYLSFACPATRPSYEIAGCLQWPLSELEQQLVPPVRWFGRADNDPHLWPPGWQEQMRMVSFPEEMGTSGNPTEIDCRHHVSAAQRTELSERGYGTADQIDGLPPDPRL